VKANQRPANEFKGRPEAPVGHRSSDNQRGRAGFISSNEAPRETPSRGPVGQARAAGRALISRTSPATAIPRPTSFLGGSHDSCARLSPVGVRVGHRRASGRKGNAVLTTSSARPARRFRASCSAICTFRVAVGSSVKMRPARCATRTRANGIRKIGATTASCDPGQPFRWPVR